MKTILRTADLTYDPSGKTIVFAQPWFRIEGLLAILNQTRGQVLYRTTDGWGGWNGGTKTLTLKSTMDTTGHSSGDSLQAIYEQPSYSDPVLSVSVAGAVTTSLIVSPAVFFYGVEMAFTSNGGVYLTLFDGATSFWRSGTASAGTDSVPHSSFLIHPVYCPSGITATQVGAVAVSHIYYRLA
jgi:hypothetical protein